MPIAASAQIHPTALIEDNVVIEERVQVAAYAVIKSGTILRQDVRVCEHAVIGGDPQDFKFKPETRSGVEVGSGSLLREGVTIHRSVREGGMTRIGQKVFMMCNSHVGHDASVGDSTILANGALIGGDAQIGPHCFLGGNAAVHQFVRVGEGAIMQGLSGAPRDVPPFIMIGSFFILSGLNIVGLKRRGFTREDINDLKDCYRAVFFRQGNPVALAQAMKPKTAVGKRFQDFFVPSRRGYINRVKRVRSEETSGEAGSTGSLS